jgi:hypothetical protein
VKATEFTNSVLRDYNYDSNKVDVAMNKRFLDIDVLKPKLFSIINKFAEDADVDGRETLYKFTDQDLRYLKEDLQRLFDE